MLGSLEMQADIGNLQLGDRHLKLRFQLCCNILCQPVILITGHFFLPFPGHLDYILLQNAVDGNGQMDDQTVIGIFRQVVHPLVIHPLKALMNPAQDFLVQQPAQVVFLQGSCIILAAITVIQLPEQLCIYVLPDKKPYGTAVIFLRSFHLNAAARLPDHGQPLMGQPCLHRFQIRADGSFANAELAAVIIQLPKRLFPQDFQHQPLAPVLLAAGSILITAGSLSQNPCPGSFIPGQPHPHACLGSKLHAIWQQHIIDRLQLPLHGALADAGLFR